jgi:hypothetical protein
MEAAKEALENNSENARQNNMIYWYRGERFLSRE